MRRQPKLIVRIVVLLVSLLAVALLIKFARHKEKQLSPLTVPTSTELQHAPEQDRQATPE